MKPEPRKIGKLMKQLDLTERISQELNAIGKNWKPSAQAGLESFNELISLENRELLKAWYAQLPSINERAENLKRVSPHYWQWRVFWEYWA